LQLGVAEHQRFKFKQRRQLFIGPHASARALLDQTHRELVYRRLQFQKRSQGFIGTQDETLSVAMRVHNPDRSPLAMLSGKHSE